LIRKGGKIFILSEKTKERKILRLGGQQADLSK